VSTHYFLAITSKKFFSVASQYDAAKVFPQLYLHCGIRMCLQITLGVAMLLLAAMRHGAFDAL